MCLPKSYEQREDMIRRGKRMMEREGGRGERATYLHVKFGYFTGSVLQLPGPMLWCWDVQVGPRTVIFVLRAYLVESVRLIP